MAGVLIVLIHLIFSVSASICIEKQVETTGVKGQATILFCESDLDNESSTFTWTKDNHTLEPSSRITMQGQILWLLNTISSDGGLYVCLSTNSTFSMETRVFLSVEAGPCLSLYDIDVTQEKNNISLSCSEERIPVLGQRLEVQWWKDCKSTGLRGSELNLFNVSMSSKGNYTCLVIFRHEDKNYTASLTYQLIVKKKETVKEPRVIQPRNKTLYVKPGVEIKLECHVFIGIGEESQQETSVYWIINNSYIDIYPDLQQNLTIEMRENSWLYGRLTLLIPEILPEFFGIPFHCVILNPVGGDQGQLWLSRDDYTNHAWLITVVLLVLAAVLSAVLLNFFKIDLILAYRHLCGKNKTIQEGNRYNACVLYFPGPGSSTAEDFALRILPSMLEQQHNLRLFIQGRDTDTGGNIASMTEVLSRSQVVMLILPGNNEDDTLIPLSKDQNRLEDSQLSVFFSDITHFGVPLLLVECENDADYSLLPESIQSSIKKDRVLKWKSAMEPNGPFWKQLRYHMT